jgi:hypothetical protein
MPEPTNHRQFHPTKKLQLFHRHASCESERYRIWREGQMCTNARWVYECTDVTQRENPSRVLLWLNIDIGDGILE